MLKAFIYNNKLYLRVIPNKPLFKSTMIHEVVNRGDIFAVDLLDGQRLTIIPGNAVVHHVELETKDCVQLLSKPSLEGMTV